MFGSFDSFMLKETYHCFKRTHKISDWRNALIPHQQARAVFHWTDSKSALAFLLYGQTGSSEKPRLAGGTKEQHVPTDSASNSQFQGRGHSWAAQVHPCDAQQPVSATSQQQMLCCHIPLILSSPKAEICIQFSCPWAPNTNHPPALSTISRLH